MIKINNFIFNENEIFNINSNEKGNVVTIVFKDNKRPSLNMFATFDDIEWNYGNNISESLSYDLAKARIEEIKPDDKHKTIWYTVDKAQYHCFLVQPKDIIKSSSNIIDLIEVGDYVNGCEIIELATNIDGKVLYLETNLTEFDNVYACGNINIYEKDIKSIVTKEQFENMKYRIGE